jgi:hypothetical protein
LVFAKQVQIHYKTFFDFGILYFFIFTAPSTINISSLGEEITSPHASLSLVLTSFWIWIIQANQMIYP